MEAWRIVATVLLAVAGIVLIPIVMAKVRERTGSSGQVALSGAITFTLVAVLCVLTLTVLPGVPTWVLVVAVGTAVGVMVLAS